MPLLAIQIFLADDLAHRLLVDLALYPGDEVQIGEGAGLESIALEMPDLFQELFELGLYGMAGHIEGSAQELEHLRFHPGEVLFFGHEAVYRLGKGFHQLEITQLIVGHEMKNTRIALKIVAHIDLIINDALQIIDTGGIVTAAKIQGSDLIIQYEQTMPVDEQIIFRQ